MNIPYSRTPYRTLNRGVLFLSYFERIDFVNCKFNNCLLRQFYSPVTLYFLNCEIENGSLDTIDEEDDIFENRVNTLCEVVKENNSNILICAKQIKIKTIQHMEEIYKGVLKKGGEGIMIKDPTSLYEDKRSNYML